MAIFGSFLKHRVRRTGQKRPIFGVNLNAPKIMSDATKTKKETHKKKKSKISNLATFKWFGKAKWSKIGQFRDYINCAKTTEKLIQG